MRPTIRKLRERKLIGISWLYIAIVLLLLFIFFFVILGIHISFVLKDDLAVTLTPRFISQTVYNNESNTTTITLKADSTLQCKSVCTYNLTDLRTDRVELTGNTGPKHDQVIPISFTFQPPGTGSGQIIYRLDVSCYNEKTIICPSDQKPKHTSSIITLNYDLTPEEELLKASYTNIITSGKNEMLQTETDFKAAGLLLESYPSSTEKEALSDQAIALTKVISFYNARLDKVMELWQKEKYTELPGAFTDQDEIGINMTKDRLKTFTDSTVSLAELTNKNTPLIATFEGKKAKLLSFALFLDERPNQNTLSMLTNITNLVIQYKNVTASRSEELLSDRLPSLIRDADSFITQQNDILNYEHVLITYGTALLTEISPPLNLSGKPCTDLQSMINMMNGMNTAFKNTTNITNERIDEQASQLSYRAMERTALIENRTTDDILSILNISVPSQLGNTSDALINTTLFLEHIGLFCPDESHSVLIHLSDFKADNITRPILNATIQETAAPSFQLPANPPHCCIRSTCAPCTSSFEHQPILFIHGHLLNNANNPESSANIFVPIQRKLEDEGMIDFGEFYLTDQDIAYGEWGRINTSITVRSSYYYLTYVNLGEYMVTTEKSENIETYAIRLHEIVESLKYRTGRPNITIIAHSMGGLVVRQYLALFGSGSVDQVILIGTPNQGITGTTKQFCKTFGSTRECDDMTEGSIFLSRLNAVLPPKNTYMIRGTGCSMDGEGGDGIVLAKNALLPGATNFEIKGNCTKRFGTNLHSDLLDPGQYPETYLAILKILRKE